MAEAFQGTIAGMFVYFLLFAVLSVEFCPFANGQSQAGTTIEPIVRIMDPNSKNITALVNNNIRLSCSVEYKPAQSSVRWFWGETMVSQDEWSIDPYMYRLYKPEINIWQMELLRVGLYHGGRYICQVRLDNERFYSDFIDITVVDPPYISSSDSSSDMVVTEATPVKLVCNATGQPRPTVKWTREDKQPLPTGGTAYIGSALSFTAKPEHRGVYLCTAFNTYGFKAVRSVDLSVKYKPIISFQSEKSVAIIQAPDYMQELFCYVRAFPPAPEGSVTWSKDGRTIEDTNDYHVQFAKNGDDKVTLRLRIQSVRERDYGLYRCSASNQESTQWQVGEIELRKTGEPQKLLTYDAVMRAGASSPHLHVVLYTSVLSFFVSRITSFSLS